MQIINLQIAPTAVNPVVNVSQYDVGRQFQLKLYDGSVAYNLPTGAVAAINGIKPDGKVFSYGDAVSVSGNTLTITTKEQMTVLSGTVCCEIRITKSGLDIGTLNFKLVVERSPINEGADISETDIPEIIELAKRQEENAEAWAVGERGGLPVPDTDETYHNNAKYYAEQAGGESVEAKEYALQAEAWAVGERESVPVPPTDETYQNNAKYYADEASDSANDAISSASAAATSEINAYDSEQAAKLSEQNAKASEQILEYYVDFVIPRFVIQNNRLYISDAAQGEFIVANNRLYIKNAS